MAQFKDTTGRTWQIVLTLGAAERLKRSELGIDLLRLSDPIAVEGYAEKLPPALLLEIDLPIVANVVWLLIEPQAIKANVSQADFLDAVDAETFSAAQEALRTALTDFSQTLRRPEQVEMLNKSRQIVAAGMSRAAKAMDAIAAEAEAEIEKAILSTRGSSSGNAPA